MDRQYMRVEVKMEERGVLKGENTNSYINT